MGEFQADQVMASKGYVKLNHDGKLIDAMHPPKGKGIDGIWSHPGPPPRYVVSETKFSTTGNYKLGKGQMTDAWIKKNIPDNLSSEARAGIEKAMNKGTHQKKYDTDFGDGTGIFW
ncbi:hypothetical protein ABIB40_004231 [Pedobacter sp. UYP30]|uniref:hypothetical protein n=1 Tax=Pedobacter sp. UYP30 TaxID=1756400 RepID=UPI003397084C